ncbi:NAD(P)H-binding protein [Nocardioides sp. Iso805N]|uniref:NAD(P)H-binding protein n=1 Tax=Nocardioides sp. Iso805N TaxID=1283287 RepID=UPI000376670D|nr:NAD(P)H-binding protein [Nocardioides sp. Iso805N]
MTKVLILGGHGKVALLLAPLLVERGDEVTSVFRNPAQEAEVAATGARPVRADIEKLDVTGLTDLLRGQDAVVWSAGAGGGDPSRTYAVDRDAAIRSMDAAVAAGVPRYVMVSYLGSRPDHGVPPDNRFFAYAEAKAAADEYLRATSLAATVLGPGRLTLDEPTGRIDIVTPDDQGDSATTRSDVAAVVAATLLEDSTVGRTIGFRNGATPIAEALRGSAEWS